MPVLAVLPRGLLVAVVEVSDELRGLLLVPSHQLFELLELPPLFLLVALELLQALQRTQREVWGQSRQVALSIRPSAGTAGHNVQRLDYIFIKELVYSGRQFIDYIHIT